MLRPAVAAILLLAFLPGCYSWRLETVAPEARAVVTRPDPPKRVRIYRTDGTQVNLLGPRVVGDSVVGTAVDTSPASQVAVALQDIAGLEAERFDARQTTALVLAPVAVLGFIWLIGLLKGLDWPNVWSF